MFFLFLISVIILLLAVNQKIFNKIIVQSRFVINNKINLAINNSVYNLTKKNNLTTNDFYSIILNEGQINFLSANTILINKFCSQLAVRIPNEFLKSGANQIDFCIGALFSSLTGLNFFNTMGPKFKINIIPIGDTLVDYETKFLSAGVNQTNFQVWLNIRFNSQVINPLNKKKFVFKKKLSLINIIINGAVPDTYVKPKARNLLD